MGISQSSTSYVPPTGPPKSVEEANFQLLDASKAGDDVFVQNMFSDIINEEGRPGQSPKRRWRMLSSSGGLKSPTMGKEPDAIPEKKFFPNVNCIDNRKRLIPADGGTDANGGDASSNGSIRTFPPTLYSPLHYACLHGRSRVAELLVDSGANVNAATPRGETPLLLAVLHNHVDCCRVLIQAGADKESLSVIPPRRGGDRQERKSVTYIDAALERGAGDALSLLVDSGVKTTGHQLLKCLIHANKNSFKSSIAMLKAMIAGGADPNYVTEPVKNDETKARSMDKLVVGQFSCLHWIALQWKNECSSTDQKYYCEAANVLMNAGADINNSENETQNTPLHFACRLGHSQCCMTFVKFKNCNCNARNSAGQTPLHLALRRKYPGQSDVSNVVECVRALLEADASPDLSSNLGYTPLGLAMSKYKEIDPEKRLHLVSMLVAKGAKAESFYLHEAFAARDARLIAVLIKGGADIMNAEAGTGHTILDKLSMLWWLASQGSGKVAGVGRSRASSGSESGLVKSSSEAEWRRSFEQRLRGDGQRTSLDGGSRTFRNTGPRGRSARRGQRRSVSGPSDDAAFLVECVRIVVKSGVDIEVFAVERPNMPRDFIQYLRRVKREVSGDSPKRKQEEKDWPGPESGTLKAEKNEGPWWWRIAASLSSPDQRKPRAIVDDDVPLESYSFANEQRLFELVAGSLDVDISDSDEEKQHIKEPKEEGQPAAVSVPTEEKESKNRHELPVVNDTLQNNLKNSIHSIEAVLSRPPVLLLSDSTENTEDVLQTVRDQNNALLLENAELRRLASDLVNSCRSIISYTSFSTQQPRRRRYSTESIDVPATDSFQLDGDEGHAAEVQSGDRVETEAVVSIEKGEFAGGA